MYAGKVYNENDERNVVEECCFDNQHVEKVRSKIIENFDNYFLPFLETKAGKIASKSKIDELKKKYGIKVQTKSIDSLKENFIEIQQQAIDDFEKDREKYEAIFDGEILDEYWENPASFKSIVLKNECPIIHWQSLLNYCTNKSRSEYRL